MDFYHISKKIGKLSLLNLPLLLMGCLFANDVSHTAQYKTMIGQIGYLKEDRCLYNAEPGQFTFVENKIETVPASQSKICIKDSSEEDYVSPIEVLPVATPINFIKTVRLKDDQNHPADYVIGEVYSQTQRKNLQFEYIVKVADENLPLPWTMTKPKQSLPSLKI